MASCRTKSSVLALLLVPSIGVSQTWQPITEEAQLTDLFSDTYFETTLTNDVQATSRYYADGTGETKAWGVTYERSWYIEEGEVCIDIDDEVQCFVIEQNVDNQEQTEIRASNKMTGTVVTFTAEKQSDGSPVLATTVTPSAAPNAGAAGKPSADEVANKLLNPANPIMKIGNNLDYVSYSGDLPGAGDQSQFKYLFLTVFPFKLDNGSSIMVRPGHSSHLRSGPAERAGWL